MDIADLELVIVYRLPTTMAMLYQVYVQQFLRIDFHINNFIQMFGRAWRGDVEAMAQLIYTTKEVNTEPNTQFVDFVSNKENCKRRTLLHIAWAVASHSLEIVSCAVMLVPVALCLTVD